MCALRRYVRLAVAALLALQGSAWAAGYVDVLELPAKSSALAVRSPLLDVALAGDRLVAVGQRGHIVYSDDVGQSWQQAQVPVSVDLNAVHFANPSQGWVVGNDGVILHSDDGGRSWRKQLDGRQIGTLLVERYKTLAQLEPDNEQWPTLIAEGERLKTEGADKPFLDVWFADAQNGFAVGVFNLILGTHDGGQTWVPLQDRSDNAMGLHLTALNSTGDALYLVGEQGLIRRWDATGQRFVALPSPYEGTFFGVIGRPGEVLLYGLRGHVFLSRDGAQSWQQLDSGLEVSVTAATQNRGGRYQLFTQAGHRMQVENDLSLSLVPQKSQSPVAGVVLSARGDLVLVGSRGVRTLASE
ncbi:YCF48-related protein [Pseudomonas sp. GOM6]|uniref:WD40/YVTN/BNR-like repeat-containing protein n=1 Tax=Pseudomonas sp. GOM6 TaxID=3036944 RepID=UPI00240A2718|nr:YCF48-related protein [Pseudomonas sp. GOM6]MDG1580397.1 YCF48-related protein [Pseudomonas sp. GOM6]